MGHSKGSPANSVIFNFGQLVTFKTLNFLQKSQIPLSTFFKEVKFRSNVVIQHLGATKQVKKKTGRKNFGRKGRKVLMSKFKTPELGSNESGRTSVFFREAIEFAGKFAYLLLNLCLISGRDESGCGE